MSGERFGLRVRLEGLGLWGNDASMGNGNVCQECGLVVYC